MKTIRLYQPHTHEGVAYTRPLEGIELTVNDADAAFLQALGLTTPTPALEDTPARDSAVDAQAGATVDVDDAHATSNDEDTAA